jgi:DNA topoisomerase-3
MDGHSAVVALTHDPKLDDMALLEALKSPELTGTWEGRLSDVADGKGDRATFMRDVRAWVNDTVSALAAAPLSAAAIVPKEDAKALGVCPACGQPVRERGPVYACDTGRSCSFVVFKTMAQRPISARLVTQLLRDGRSAPVKGFKSKAGKEFSASLEWSPADAKVRFAFEDRLADGPMTAPSTKSEEPRKAKSTSPRPKGPPSAAPGPGQPCPSCGVGLVMVGRTKLGCSRWREGCAWTAPATTP